jgi:ribosomal protein S18 acetylase RimI-like enzyme
MLRIREMRVEDVPFAIRLTNPEGWGIPAADFRRILRLDSHGSFVAAEGHRRIGLATSAHYGRQIAWIGNVVVDRKYRGRHVGQMLVEHAVNYLSKGRVRHIALYSFKENYRFYRNIGFVAGARFVRMRREPERQSRTFTIETSKPLRLSSLLAMDAKAFGADRRRLITALLSGGLAWYFGYKTGSRGSYVIVKRYRDMNEVGPWVSFGLSPQELDLLLQFIISRSGRKPIEIGCPVANSQILRVMKKHHFHVINEGRVMFYKREARLGQPRAIIAQGFLDKG